MDSYITGNTIKTLREKAGMKQSRLAELLCVSDKTVSKWETGKGLPDISLIEPIAKALKISVPELLSGECIINSNRCANMIRSVFYVCPVCGNIIHATGNTAVSCCGISLPVSEAEEPDEEHMPVIEKDGCEYYVTFEHEMTKQHYISFIAYVTSDRCETVKLYPEGAAQARFFIRGNGRLFWYCSHHGFFGIKL